MVMLATTKTIGVTVRFVVEGNEQLARILLDSLPGDFTIAGRDLSSVSIGVRGREVEPVRVSIRCEDVSFDAEDVFLENG